MGSVGPLDSESSAALSGDDRKGSVILPVNGKPPESACDNFCAEVVVHGLVVDHDSELAE